MSAPHVSTDDKKRRTAEMTTLQLVASVVVGIEIGIIVLALCWPSRPPSYRHRDPRPMTSPTGSHRNPMGERA
ncbi:hypothetical protein [Nocardia paucivorans]|uniref:hypothetical protein n=1 Tax=Nocardia paucivorans TaxID=114259 RepID=UPI00059431C4|nr:hypothetical protein [Nocardia paucivorans]